MPGARAASPPDHLQRAYPRNWQQTAKAASPLVTVIVPAYGCAGTIAATLASISQQSHANLEILVVDDGSTDDTSTHVRLLAKEDRRIRLIEQENGGVARARNAGLAQARGEFVAYIDADDLWHPEKLASQLVEYSAAPEPPSFVYTGYRLIDDKDRVLPNYRPLVDVAGDTLCRQIATNFFSNVSSILVPTTLARAVGGHDPSLRNESIEGAEDLLMQLRLAAIGPVACCTSALVGYRMHADNMSRDHFRAACSNLHALEIIAKEQPLVPKDVVRLGRARVIGYLPMLLSEGRMVKAWRLFWRLAAGQPMRTVEMGLRIALQGPGFIARSHANDPELGKRFHEADPATAHWNGHMFLTDRRKRWLARIDARLAKERCGAGLACRANATGLVANSAMS